MGGRIAVVDDANRFVRWEDRRVIHEQHLVHRSVHVMIMDGYGRLLIQRRHATKQTYPRYWDISVAGHVEESDYLGGPDDRLDEVYATVAAREVQEELGVSPALTYVAPFKPEPGVHYEQIRLFRGYHDGPFTLQADEIEEVKWLDPADTAAFIASGEPITAALGWWLGYLARGRGAPW